MCAHAFLTKKSQAEIRQPYVRASAAHTGPGKKPPRDLTTAHLIGNKYTTRNYRPH